jgi:predicted transcriptional regulator
MQVEEIGHDEDGDPITSVRLDFEGELSFDREANNASTTTQAEEEETNGSRLLLALHDNPNATLVELGDTINIARQNVHKWMKKLEKEKYVRNIAGKWVITGTGKRAVRDLNQCANSTNE